MYIALLLNKRYFAHGTARANDHGRETRANNSEAGKQWRTQHTGIQGICIVGLGAPIQSAECRRQDHIWRKLKSIRGQHEPKENCATRHAKKKRRISQLPIWDAHLLSINMLPSAQCPVPLEIPGQASTATSKHDVWQG